MNSPVFEQLENMLNQERDIAVRESIEEIVPSLRVAIATNNREAVCSLWTTYNQSLLHIAQQGMKNLSQDINENIASSSYSDTSLKLALFCAGIEQFGFFFLQKSETKNQTDGIIERQ